MDTNPIRLHARSSKTIGQTGFYAEALGSQFLTGWALSPGSVMDCLSTGAGNGRGQVVSDALVKRTPGAIDRSLLALGGAVEFEGWNR